MTVARGEINCRSIGIVLLHCVIVRTSRSRGDDVCTHGKSNRTYSHHRRFASAVDPPLRSVASVSPRPDWLMTYDCDEATGVLYRCPAVVAVIVRRCGESGAAPVAGRSVVRRDFRPAVGVKAADWERSCGLLRLRPGVLDAARIDRAEIVVRHGRTSFPQLLK